MVADTRDIMSFVNIRSNEQHQDKDNMQELGGNLGRFLLVYLYELRRAYDLGSFSENAPISLGLWTPVIDSSILLPTQEKLYPILELGAGSRHFKTYNLY